MHLHQTRQLLCYLAIAILTPVAGVGSSEKGEDGIQLVQDLLKHEQELEALEKAKLKAVQSEIEAAEPFTQLLRHDVAALRRLVKEYRELEKRGLIPSKDLRELQHELAEKELEMRMMDTSVANLKRELKSYASREVYREKSKSLSLIEK